MTTPDYATWLTKEQAAEAIGVTTKTVERFVQAGQIQQARWQPEGRGPIRAVYQPDDVARLAQERRPGPLPPFLLPVGATGSLEPPTNGNGRATAALERVGTAGLQNRETGPGEDLLRVLVAAAVKVMSQTSETSTLYVTVQ